MRPVSLEPTWLAMTEKHPTAIERKATAASKVDGTTSRHRDLTSSRPATDNMMHDSASNSTYDIDSLADPSVEQEVLTWSVGCSALILLIFVIMTIKYIMKQRHTPFAQREAKRKKEKQRKALEEKRINKVTMNPILCQDYLTSYRSKVSSDALSIEFKALARLDEVYPQTVAMLPSNMPKNQNNNILPYDHSRVCLDITSSPMDSDYINASFIYKQRGSGKMKGYIATQGPLPTTIGDFWRMCWQERSTTIVMLTNLFSYTKQECEKYWHNSYAMFGDINVNLELVESTCSFTIRRFLISKAGSAEKRTLTQFQCQTWQEQESPDAATVLELLRRVKCVNDTSKGPLIVHCSDGASRTGTFIALDMILNTIRERGLVEILNTITWIRRFRPKMVSNLNQFKMIHEAVFIYLTCGTTVVKANEVSHLIAKLNETDAKTGLSGFQKEYSTLKEVIPKLTIGDCAGGHRAENRRKSRDIMVQPPERARPYMITFDSTDSSDFVNAVYVDGYREVNEFIITQWPLKNTCNDFWRLVFDAHISAVAVLHDRQTSRNFPEFWPSKLGVKQRFGPVCSTMIDIEHTANLTVATFNVKKVLYIDMVEHCEKPSNISEREAIMQPGDILKNQADIRAVQVIFLKAWPDSQRAPAQSHAMMELIDRTNGWKSANSATRTPTLVVSRNGVSRVGVFCAVCISLDKIQSEDQVDIFNAARTVMINRPQLIENLMELQQIYYTVETLSQRDS